MLTDGSPAWAGNPAQPLPSGLDMQSSIAAALHLAGMGAPATAPAAPNEPTIKLASTGGKPAAAQDGPSRGKQIPWERNDHEIEGSMLSLWVEFKPVLEERPPGTSQSYQQQQWQDFQRRMGEAHPQYEDTIGLSHYHTLYSHTCWEVVIVSSVSTADTSPFIPQNGC
jgi:hypothetical protein